MGTVRGLAKHSGDEGVGVVWRGKRAWVKTKQIEILIIDHLEICNLYLVR